MPQGSNRYKKYFHVLPDKPNAVKHQDFRTCANTSFCRRNRAYADKISANHTLSPYIVLKETLKISNDNGILSGDLFNINNKKYFVFELHFLLNNVARLRIDEKSPLKPRYDQAKIWALVEQEKPLRHTLEYSLITSDDNDHKFTTITYGEQRDHKVVIHHSPFHIQFFLNDVPMITLNELLVDQSNQENIVKNDNDVVEDVNDTSFNGKTDTKPNGPESIGLDINFPGFSHVYGIPEHASTLSLKETRGGDGAYNEPYRLYNLDVFEYELDNPMALYGSIPFMIAHRKGNSAAVFWLNAAETWIDITKSKEENSGLSRFLKFGKSNHFHTSTQTHWFSESGIIDVFAFLGPTTSDIFQQYGDLTGFTAMPASFAIGYHQCRWNYIDQKDVEEVDQGFDTHDIPYDVIWLDIEHTDSKKYFTWDLVKFPEPVKMQTEIGHENYYLYKEALDQDLFVKDVNGKVFDAWCWPGSSSWPDFINPLTYLWWPSVFSGPEITMPKDLIHYGGWEHRNLHNIYGLVYHSATSVGLSNRTNPAKRPFVLSRAFFAGTQRYGAIWTGDNAASWDHLAISTPMLLTIGISGVPFSGADVGGFFGNPAPELLVRWYQVGAFQPFFRAHAHIDTKRREPWLMDEPYTGYIREAIRSRYTLLPLWYTLFYEASIKGLPIIRPMFVVFPDDEDAFAIEDQFFVGDSLLVKPIVKEGQTSTEIYFSENDIYYDYFTYEKIKINSHKAVEIEAPLDKIPVFIKGGSIIPQRQRIRRSSAAMILDPITLVIALDKKGEANGFNNQKIPTKILAYHNDDLSTKYALTISSSETSHLVIKVMKLLITKDWTIEFIK
nr:5448_t:CDS:10 [Entrophospora candida]